ncbi:Nodule Cysteine-Rich (NCR) secreted peptide [Medicago truncatula]|uniref:Nodule Cysteine-Rich (NCR) secreted peptide n=2 Tax=Medicago truncatula TaxID=3880 RepID=A0A072U6R1_MEDTR|nr:Nodule Cysteine-Rich (NCR) secreted peptide [Medicago truncatula]
MTAILKVAYIIMIICLFLLHDAASDDYLKYIYRCQNDGDCDQICATHGISKCVATMCFCNLNL